MNYNIVTTPKRVVIFGRSGSGKSTFAAELHKILNLPLHHLDKHFYQSNWASRNYQEFLEIQQRIVNNNLWIVDGNNTKSLEMRYKRADLVLYFNYPRWLCYLRIFKRLFYKDSAIDDRAEECRETIRLDLLRYMWSFENMVAERINLLKEKYPQTQFVEIKNNRDLKNFKNTILSKPHEQN